MSLAHMEEFKVGETVRLSPIYHRRRGYPGCKDNQATIISSFDLAAHMPRTRIIEKPTFTATCEAEDGTRKTLKALTALNMEHIRGGRRRRRRRRTFKGSLRKYK